ncbi:hypothetical protein [Nonomuraea turcica]|uniref:hypothetical protein n=1 Tax=Nonomuraea sp. G32 TaxID=3067274 RepID=UPI00273B6C5A|nr:hypothetical protein [Nonomuraea sp. G32]MDP4509328.1 hypothetical protein [Nonomuraea sp. G32]
MTAITFAVKEGMVGGAGVPVGQAAQLRFVFEADPPREGNQGLGIPVEVLGTLIIASIREGEGSRSGAVSAVRRWRRGPCRTGSR